MAKRSKKGRDITGIVIIDKPTGLTSNHVLQRVKRLFNANKAGHTGSLDPLATGVLPVCLGEATKLSTYLLDADKQYQVRCQLGILTDSGDSDGDVIAQQNIPDYSEEKLQRILQDFTGELQQIPPMFSALKHQGQPLYKLARQGIEIERKSRLITIYSIELLACDADSFTLQVSCSKGTYIRTLVQDIAAALGSCGHVTMLRRTDAAGYDLTQALSLERLQDLAEQQGLPGLDSQLLPAHEALPDWPEVRLDADMSADMRFGRSVTTEFQGHCAKVRLFDVQDQFIGLGELAQDGTVSAKRLFVTGDTV
ncbi:MULTISPECIES: tRNA pseudouridine(55) synthase TruB [unclassified Methylophaga]|uniref:tRNA pseudouridine(55) synthase TruB n=1 Tax=unclassified Methylophaga TaxID=2629249 RepID=UPI000C8B360F|nr:MULTISPECIES: tRNA pseudouridine(55) synthase TruB [unclassified Methylophaga]MBN47577.1 tRNA pseudouridine(55) synthase TruB [Methylophaga sp.]|tara:strand:- start:18389 stop:19318 length:930 start_codon:yes stop_codon:yes gene_type:complete